MMREEASVADETVGVRLTGIFQGISISVMAAGQLERAKAVAEAAIRAVGEACPLYNPCTPPEKDA